ncbi:10058_t:CDS:2, partial [Scutellospora calospora]
LVRMCPSVVKLAFKEWQRQVTNILSLSGNIETSSESKTLQFLRICNDLIVTQLINISDIVDAITIKQEPDSDEQLPDLDEQVPDSDEQAPDSDEQVPDSDEQEPPNQQEPDPDIVDEANIQQELNLNNLENILSQEFVDRILELFENIPSTERIMTSLCSFFRRSVLSRVLLSEEDFQPGIFIQLIQNAKATLN